MAIAWLSSKLCRVSNDPWGEYGHWCPGCLEMHVIAVAAQNPSGARWTFDGDLNRPTFAPSVHDKTGPYPGGRIDVCHYFLRAGRIDFLSDCTHALRGQTVDLPDIPETWSRFAPPYRPSSPGEFP